MAAQREPGRDCLVVDKDGDIWAWSTDGWSCMTEAAMHLLWSEVATGFGPVEVYHPQTDDGAATPGHGLGGSPPGRRPEASEVVSGPAPSSPTDEMPGPAGIGGQPGVVSSNTGDGAGAARASQDMPGPSPLPRSFQLIRHHDVSGVSGTGLVAEGTQFRDGAVALRWYGDHPSTVAWPSVDDIVAVHGHDGATELRWLDIDLWPSTEGDHP